MIPHEAIVAMTASFSNHCSRKSTALIVMIWTKAALQVGGQLAELPEHGRKRQPVPWVEPARIRRDQRQDRLDEPDDLGDELANSWYASASFTECRRSSWYVRPGSFVIHR